MDIAPVKYALFVKYEHDNDDQDPTQTSRTWVFEGFADSDTEREAWVREIKKAMMLDVKQSNELQSRVRIINFNVYGLPL